MYAYRLISLVACVVMTFPIDRVEAQPDEPSAPEPSAPAEAADTPEVPPAVAALQPLFQQIVKAESTRATVELFADTIVDGAVINSQKSVYQIASEAPNQFTIYLKDDNQRTRIYCDGEKATIALSESAYTELEKPIALQQAVFDLPVPMGPYPEPILALTLAGVDPAFSLTNGMKSVRLVDRDNFRGETPAIHFEGIQDDDVQWDLWITQDPAPKPLRLRIDLTEMLRANGGLELSAGYRYALRCDFKVWRIDHKNDASLFQYQKIKDAKQYDSVQAYFDQAGQ